MVRTFCCALVVTGALAVSGCGALRGSCHKPAPYQSAQSAEPLRIPPGLDAPDTRNALRIPELDEPRPPPRKEGDPCLDTPPRYAIPSSPEA